MLDIYGQVSGLRTQFQAFQAISDPGFAQSTNNAKEKHGSVSTHHEGRACDVVNDGASFVPLHDETVCQRTLI